MPFNCLIKCLINFWAFARFVFKKSIHVQFMNNSWTFMFQKGGSSRSNRLRLLPFDKVEHALRRAFLRYAQIAQLATHARYLHALQCTRGFVIPQNDGVWFFKTMGFISQNDAYIWWVWTEFEQGLNRICSMIVQWLFNGWRMVVTMRCVLRFLLRAWMRFVFFWDEEEILHGMSGMG